MITIGVIFHFSYDTLFTSAIDIQYSSVFRNIDDDITPNFRI